MITSFWILCVLLRWLLLILCLLLNSVSATWHLISWPVVCILGRKRCIWYLNNFMNYNSFLRFGASLSIVFWDSWPVTSLVWARPGPGLRLLGPVSAMQSAAQSTLSTPTLTQQSQAAQSPHAITASVPNCTFMTRHWLPHAFSAWSLSNFL